MLLTEAAGHLHSRRGYVPAAVVPCRVVRDRRAGAVTPHGAIYVGRPTMWGNPFERRAKIGHARSVILFGAWIAGDLTSYILGRAGFGEHEIATLDRFRARIVRHLHQLRGLHLECWCPLTSPWCHADVLLRLANGRSA